MVPILVVLTIVVFLLVDLYLRHGREATRRAALAPAGGDARNVFLHPGHSWARLTPDGLVSVGASGFASNFAGGLTRIRPPAEGRHLRQGEPAWTLVSKRGRQLTQVMPLEGKVLAVNHEVLRDPSLIQRSPYDKGWILRVRPRRLADGVRNLVRSGAARAWQEALRASVTRRLGAPLGAVAQDGGEWVSAFGDRLDDEIWEETRRELFPDDDETVRVA